ncbi:lytic transglycosylase domain-containing protein [Herbidospora cretacea]|uniref:lytic transglycosylase domain-containing protein n=1 Tax=Herbidospora cretacea TaxID=28444 RepID=UPI0007743066|nr:lytic transglycosylase domain-containing protein [Herbidospora cretacea]
MNRAPRHPRFTPLLALVAGLAATIVVTLTAGGVFLLGAGEEQPVAGEDVPNLVPDRTIPSAPPAIGGPGVQVTPPQLLGIAPRPVPQETVLRIAKVKHVQKVALVAGGGVRLSGHPLQLLAVEPAQFRSWTPKPVAEHPEVWSAIARGEVVADRAVMKRLGMILGEEYQVDNGPRLRIAASATLGFPNIDGLISKDLGQRLGFSDGVVVLVHGEKVSGTRVRKLMGTGSSVVPIGVVKEQRPAGRDAAPKQTLVGRPESYLELYQRSAAVCPGLSWTVLAAIGQVESGHGRNNGPSSAGALGPMQFMPATWRAYGVDGDGDGEADIWSAYDAVPGAANYLCATGAAGGGESLRKAVWAYNHSWDYVNKVLGLAAAYARAYP